MWYVYMVRCADDTIYTGISNDISSRMRAHNEGTGARYTRFKRPVILVYSEVVATRSKALVREAKIKKLSRYQKEQLINEI